MSAKIRFAPISSGSDAATRSRAQKSQSASERSFTLKSSPADLRFQCAQELPCHLEVAPVLGDLDKAPPLVGVGLAPLLFFIAARVPPLDARVRPLRGVAGVPSK